MRVTLGTDIQLDYHNQLATFELTDNLTQDLIYPCVLSRDLMRILASDDQDQVQETLKCIKEVFSMMIENDPE